MASFSDTLNQYIQQLNCTASELATQSELSASSISRYCAGSRTPRYDSDTIQQLAKGICRIATAKNMVMTEEDVVSALFSSIRHSEYPDFAQHFDQLVSALSVNLSDLSKSVKFDASYLSRIRNGSRTPTNIDEFVDDVCLYVSKKQPTQDIAGKLALLLSCEETELQTPQDIQDALFTWFDTPMEKEEKVDGFLSYLDQFDLNAYIRSIHFDELKVPTMPFHLPTSKTYFGLEQIRQGELDFFKATVLSKSKEPIFMCSDMPMEDMAEDVDFGKKWMFGVAMSIKKGLHLNIIHNIDRPFNEMMLGLESWIPIYMTGQVSPYHLKNVSSDIYHHLNYVSGAAALTGDCIDGYHNETRYYLTNNKEEMAFYRKKSEHLLSKASPLMEIYRTEDQSRYERFRVDSATSVGRRISTLSTLPLFTISKELLESILSRHNVSASQKNSIRSYYAKQRSSVESILTHSTMEMTVPQLSREEFEQHPLSLSLSELFLEENFSYTYEEYLQHMEESLSFAQSNPSFVLTPNASHTFRNIQIETLDGQWSLISKNHSPVVHFLVRHPKMVSAIQNFTAPVEEN